MCLKDKLLCSGIIYKMTKSSSMTLLRGKLNLYIDSMSCQRVNAYIWWPTHRECIFLDCCSIGES